MYIIVGHLNTHWLRMSVHPSSVRLSFVPWSYLKN